MIERTQENWYSFLFDYFDRRRYLINNIIEWLPIDYLDTAVEFRDWGKLIIHNHNLSSERVDQIIVVDECYEEPFHYMDEEEWRLLFGKKLRNKLIKRFGIQEDVASKIGLSRISLNRYCSGKASPSLYNINKIANNLKISLSEFYISPIERANEVVVRPNEFWDEAVENVKKERPDIATECIGWYPVGLDEITIKTKSRDRYLYNINNHCFVYICGDQDSEWNNELNCRRRYEQDIFCFIDEVEWREQFSNRLSEIMKHNNIDKDELIYKTGISFSNLYYYMIGKTTPSLYNATKMVRALGCTLTDFQVMA